MTSQESKKLELHQQRTADLRAFLLLLELGARIRVDAPREQQTVGAQPAKDGAA